MVPSAWSTSLASRCTLGRFLKSEIMQVSKIDAAATGAIYLIIELIKSIRLLLTKGFKT
jgi:hypothetical protein